MCLFMILQVYSTFFASVVRITKIKVLIGWRGKQFLKLSSFYSQGAKQNEDTNIFIYKNACGKEIGAWF